MLATIVCLAGVFVVLLISEILDQKKLLKGDDKRQFIHIFSGVVIAFWPWLIGWRTIELLGLLMLAVVLLNQRQRIIDFHANLNRRSYGDMFYALAVTVSAMLTHQKVFFAVAILTMSVGDGLANIVGRKYGDKWLYTILGHTKSVVGSMVLWFVSLCILGVGLFFTFGTLNFSDYLTLLILLPPVLFVIENIAVYGLDNLAVPIVIILALNLVS